MATMELKSHWESIYAAKAPHEVSWYQTSPVKSLEMIKTTGLSKDANIIDVGAGSSTLVDHLVSAYAHVGVVDISAKALEVSKKRLGPKSNQVTWFCGDLFEVILPAGFYDVWHDRALFHFLTDKEKRQQYVRLVSACVKPGGHVIIATFSLAGPPRCSNLDVVRYSPEALSKEFGPDFRLIDSAEEEHPTPFGTIQKFIYCHFQKH